MSQALVTTEDLYSIYRQHPVVCTDSRQLTPGCLFFALKGDHFDGNRYAATCLHEGAAYAVVDDLSLSGARFLHVPDVLQALQALANHHRRQFEIPMIAIGGSNGKTTTKELISAVLSSHYPCHFTRGNLNNHIGVPLTLLAMPDETEVAVIEMGTNQPGDLDELCAIAAPSHGLLTNIGKEHLEGFGNLAGVKKAEGELYRYLAGHKGCVFVNASEKYLTTMTRRNTRKVVYQCADTLRANEGGSIYVQLLDETPFVNAAFMSEKEEAILVNTNLIGRHNFSNVMTAIALGIYFKVPGVKIKAAIEAYVPANNRSQVIHQGSNTILLDAYNANPSSMKPALESMKSIQSIRKVAILGDMLELGAGSLKEHKAMLRFAAGLKLDQLVLVGPIFGQTDYRRYKALHFDDVTAAKSWFNQQNFQHTLLLLKGSRGIKLESML